MIRKPPRRRERSDEQRLLGSVSEAGASVAGLASGDVAFTLKRRQPVFISRLASLEAPQHALLQSFEAEAGIGLSERQN